MKALLIVLVSVTLSLGVSAQRKGGYYHRGSRIVIVPSFSYGFGYGYPYFGHPYIGYPYGYPPPYYGSRMPYKLSLEIQSIKIDYNNKIREARKDKSVSHSQRRQEIRSLKTERDLDIINAQKNFRTGRRYDQNPGLNDNQHLGNDHTSSGDNS
ncbi:MAG: hypothetical protein ABI472_22090 [Ginsengibacter sp.]